FFFQAEDGIRDRNVTGVQTCALPISWIVDPLDGTTNFIHGFPQYAVSVALRHKGVLTQAVIYDPTDNELFTATRGRGAYLNERRSEERRVGKECRSRWSPRDYKKKQK